MANWFCATFPGSPFIANLIVARPGRGHRSSLFIRELRAEKGGRGKLAFSQ